MNAVAGELALKVALSPWERRLSTESLARWLVRGAILGFIVFIGVVLVGWVLPIPEDALRPWALQTALIPLLASLVVGLWPRDHVRRAAELDERLRLGDRLATAWSFRSSETPIAQLQRSDALARLRRQTPRSALPWRTSRPELIALGATALLALLLATTPSPQQAVLDRQAAQAVAVQAASQQLDTLRQQAEVSAALTPDQRRQLDALLQQAQAELDQAQTQQDASAVLAATQNQVSQQLGDPNAELRDEALAAMSEALAAEPQTQALADALQHEDAQAASNAIQDMAAHADQLSDVERQALSRALQRAANVGRSDARTSNALRDAAQAVGSNASAQQALSQANAALRDSIQASQSQAAVNATVDQLRNLQSRLASGEPLSGDAPQLGVPNAASQAVSSGTPVALDSGGASSQTTADPSQGQGGGAGTGATTGAYQSLAAPDVQAAENIFVPGRADDAAGTDQGQVNQPFSVRGAPRPYRDVLNQYAQSSRDYVDRPDISPAVRDLVKQYFQQLESDQ